MEVAPKLLCCTIIAACTNLAAAQTIVYNQPNRLLGAAAYFPGGIEYGDDLTLAARPRTITDISTVFELGPSGNQNPTLTVTMFIRPMVGSTPSATPLWSGSAVFTPHGTGSLTPFQVDMAVPNVTVPDSVYVGFAVDLGPNPPPWIGFQIGGNATVGYSDPTYYWSYNGTNFAHGSLGTNSSNYRMTVTAVPEPISATALLLGSLCLLRRKR